MIDVLAISILFDFVTSASNLFSSVINCKRRKENYCLDKVYSD